jgi:hypothetical protein
VSLRTGTATRSRSTADVGGVANREVFAIARGVYPQENIGSNELWIRSAGALYAAYLGPQHAPGPNGESSGQKREDNKNGVRDQSSFQDYSYQMRKRN